MLCVVCHKCNTLFTHPFLFLIPSTFADDFTKGRECEPPQRGVTRAKIVQPHTCNRKAPTAKKTMAMNQETIQEITDLVTARTLFATKEVLTSEETARYLGISKSYLYKLTMRREIPHYKPMGKMCYFNRRELEAWLQSNRVASDAELTAKAAAYCGEKGGAA